MIGELDATELLIWGIVLHLGVDWLLQNDWIVLHKASLRHPAAWVHAGIHGAALALIFPPIAAVAVAATHLLIDTRWPLGQWDRAFQHISDTPQGDLVRMWSDQVLHILVLAAAALLVTS